MILTGFKDRTEAGQSLARQMERFAGRKDVVVMGLPRGGMPVAYEIAKVLRAPLDAFVVGKLGFPGQPELAFGAVTSEGIRTFNEELLEESDLSEHEVEAIVQRKLEELGHKKNLYRKGKAAVPVEGREVILVDDGAATGASLRVALQALRKMNPKSILVAVPVASSESLQAIQIEADEVVCLQIPQPFHSVGQWYEDFRQVSDEDVVRCLDDAKTWQAEPASGGGIGRAREVTSTSVRVPAGGVSLSADLSLPGNPVGFILFAHGSGSSRRSPRNRQVARFLCETGFATLLLDLLTREEEEIDRETTEYRFDVALLAERLIGATRWASSHPGLSRLQPGFFGASTGAAAALIAAARLPGTVGAVVSRGGRPDLAGDALPVVSAPTLLIVGGEDETVLELNRHALVSMRCERKLEVIPGATHLFEEPGALEEVSRLAGLWFTRHLSG